MYIRKVSTEQEQIALQTVIRIASDSLFRIRRSIQASGQNESAKKSANSFQSVSGNGPKPFFRDRAVSPKLEKAFPGDSIFAAKSCFHEFGQIKNRSSIWFSDKSRTANEIRSEERRVGKECRSR